MASNNYSAPSQKERQRIISWIRYRHYECQDSPVVMFDANGSIVHGRRIPCDEPPCFNPMPGSHYYLQRDSEGNTHKGASNFIQRATAELELKEGMKEEYVRNLLNSMFGRMLPSSPKIREKQQARLVTGPVAQATVKVDPVRLEEIEQANELRGKVEEIASEYGLDLATISNADRQACIQLASNALKATPAAIKRVSAREFFKESDAA